MAKKHNYVQVTNDQRKELIRLIYQEGMTIKKASKQTGIPYPNAKSVNQIYLQEKRIAKKTSRFRLKVVDHGRRVERNLLKIEILNPYEGMPSEIRRRTCGIAKIITKNKNKNISVNQR